MEWLKNLLEGIENSDELQKKIQQELAKHFKPAAIFNEKSEELKKANAEIEDLNTKIKEIEKLGAESEDVKRQLSEVSEKLANYKASVEEDKANRAKEQGLIKKLRSLNVIEGLIDVVMVKADLSQLSIDGQNLIGVDAAAEKLKNQYPEAFSKETTASTQAGNGVSNNNTIKNPFIAPNISLKAQTELYRKDPDLYERYRKEAKK